VFVKAGKNKGRKKIRYVKRTKKSPYCPYLKTTKDLGPPGKSENRAGFRDLGSHTHRIIHRKIVGDRGVK